MGAVETLFDQPVPEKEKYTSADMRAMLRERHPAKEWALMFEVGNSTGSGHHRWADAVAVHLWPSQGNAIHGFEIKVSRSDWAREIAAPQKAEEIEQYCDFWWLAAPKGIVKLEELPTGWGLVEAFAGKLRVVVKAAKRQNTSPLTRGFVAAMLRRASGADAAEIAALVEKQVAPIRERMRDDIEREVERRSRKAVELAAKVEKIEAASGRKIDDWSVGEEFGAAVRMVHELGTVRAYGLTESLVRTCEAVIGAAAKYPSPTTGGRADGR